jgi:hypothetical protein
MTPKGLTGNALRLERYNAMVGLLSTWRLDPGIQALEKGRKAGRILGFVRGLRFASQLIYALRAALADCDVEVSWGHLLDDEQTLCSPECDIVIHKSGTVHRWNGDTGGAHVMDFKFIKRSNVVAVVSCKSFIRQLDRNYPSQMAKYCAKTYLFSECFSPVSAGRLRSQAKSAGYAGCCCLYTLKKSQIGTNEKDWLDFVDKVAKTCGAKASTPGASRSRKR